MDKEFYICEFCGCHTNAHARACCNEGRNKDLRKGKYKPNNYNEMKSLMRELNEAIFRHRILK